MKNLDLIINSFYEQTNCPICNQQLIRSFATSFRGAQGSSTFISSPKNTIEYEGLIFNKENDSAAGNAISGTPSSCDLLHFMPPSIHYMTISNTYMICPKTHYQLWFDAPKFDATMERFMIEGFDIIVEQTQIKELGHDLNIPTSRNYIQACTSEEIVGKVQKLLLIQ